MPSSRRDTSSIAARAKATAIRARRQASGSPMGAGRAVSKAHAKSALHGDDTSTDDIADARDGQDAQRVGSLEASSEKPSGRLRRISKSAIGVFTISCSIALMALSVWLVQQHRNVVAERTARADFDAAAKRSVMTLLSLDFKDAQSDVQRIIDSSTGQFKSDFESQAADFVKVTQESKVVTDVNFAASAVESMSGDTAQAIVAVASSITNAAGAKEEPRTWRLSVELKRDDGEIKMSKVEIVP